MSRAQRSVNQKRVYARLLRAMALQTRDLHEFRIWNGPGSATQHFMLHRIRGTGAYRFRLAEVFAFVLPTNASAPGCLIVAFLASAGDRAPI